MSSAARDTATQSNAESPLGASTAAAVDPARLEKLIADLAGFGARSDGGVDRQALTPEDFESRRFLIDLARSYGAEAFRDAIGNLFFRRTGTDPDATPVVTGSHADSQPTGGRLDGAYGVCAGIEVLAALADTGATHRRPIEVAVWTNEEGCRFLPGSMGASAFTEPARLAEFLATTDGAGRSVQSELDDAEWDFTDVAVRELATPMYAFVEAHIEQGPIMAAAGKQIGVVQGIQGTRWFEVELTGTAAHAGSTPRAGRKDAFRAATDFASEVYRMFEAGDDWLRMTIGTVKVEPGSTNVIPERVHMTLDVRHPEEKVLDEVEQHLQTLVGRWGDRGRCTRTMAMAPTAFDDRVRTAIRRSAEALDLPLMEISSGAFHDSLHLAHHCPTGMVFVPSIDGLSHNPAEDTDLDDLVAGTRVLAATLVALADD